MNKIAVSAALAVVIPGLIALGLIVSDRPVADLRIEGQGLDFNTLAGGDLPDLQPYAARDGATLGFRRWDSGVEGAPLVVAVHGSGWHGAQYAAMGAGLASEGFDVLAPDLRGHGPAPQRRGDIDHIGQLEEDLADLIAAQAGPGQQVTLLGHSSGGGLVLRFAGGVGGALIDNAVLLAPFVQHDAPTTQPDSGGWARVLLRRIIGLTMLNSVRITALNHLPVLQFRFPASVLDGPQGHTATQSYSFRLMTGFNPHRDWQADVAALPPFLLVAGRQDEAFIAEAYEPTFSPLTDRGHYVLTEASHLSVVDDPETWRLISRFLRGE
ncbi:MAG: alpha/beta hydrolase [Pararhodobacter sp.]